MALQPISDNLSIVSGGAEVAPQVATKVTSDLEVPNNDTSVQQFVPYVAINATTCLKVPNNNCSGMQVTIDVPRSIEIPNNFGPQLVPHVATKVTIVLEAANNNSSGQQDDKSDNGDLKPGALFAVGDCVTSIAAILSNPPSIGDPVYLVAVGIVFTAGVLAVLAALWVSHDTRNRRTAKRKIMYASVATFILGLVLNVYAYKVKNKK